MVYKRLFIGSTVEQLSILNKVEDEMNDITICVPWTKAFSTNKSALDSLIKQTRLSDYAILIATKDDKVKKRKTNVLSPRDNVVLEFGLFLGATSPERCFLLAEEGADLPTDLNGINVSTFTKEPGKYNSLDVVLKEIKEDIKKSLNVSELGLLPSTALAIGYFNGFLKKVCTEITRTGMIMIDGQSIKVKSLKIHVIIPEELEDDGVETFTAEYNKHHKMSKATTYVEATTGAHGRGYPFHFKVDPPEADLSKPIDIAISDIPNTIGTIVDALKLYLPSNTVGLDKDHEHLERRELANFAEVLKHLVSKNSLTKKSVVIECGIKLP